MKTDAPISIQYFIYPKHHNRVVLTTRRPLGQEQTAEQPQHHKMTTKHVACNIFL